MSISLHDYFAVHAATVTLRVHGESIPTPLQRLAEAASWLRLELAPTQPTGMALSLHAARPCGALEWYGPIEARQLEPLVEALRALGTGRAEFDTPATPALLGELRSPVSLDVYVSSRYPYCPAVTAACLRFAVATPLISVRVRRADWGEPPRRITAVPTVQWAGQSISQGPIGEYALATKLMDSVGENAPAG